MKLMKLMIQFFVFIKDPNIVYSKYQKHSNRMIARAVTSSAMFLINGDSKYF